MAYYNPPTSTTPIFDPSVFDTGENILTVEEADIRYLRYPYAQGDENLLNTTVNGTLVASGLITANEGITANNDITITTGKKLITPAITLNGSDLSTTLQSIVTAFGQSSMPKSGGTFTGDVTFATGKKLTTPAITLSGTDLTTTLGTKMDKVGGTFTGDVTIDTGKKLITPAITLNGSDLSTTLQSIVTAFGQSSMPKSGGTFTGDVTFASTKKLNFTCPHSTPYISATSTSASANFISITADTTNIKSAIIDGTLDIQSITADRKLKLSNAVGSYTNYLEFFSSYENGSAYMDCYNSGLNIRYVVSSPTVTATQRIAVTSTGVDLTGATTITGATNITGTTAISGNFAVTGDTTFTGDLTMNTNEDIKFINGTGKINLGTSGGQRIIVWDTGNQYSYYGFGIETDTLRYNCPRAAKHIFSVNNVAGTAYNNVCEIYSGGLGIIDPNSSANLGFALNMVDSGDIATDLRKTLAFGLNMTSGSYNGIVQTGDRCILASGFNPEHSGTNTNALSIGTHSNTTNGIRITSDSVNIAGTSVTVNGSSIIPSFKATVKLLTFGYNDYTALTSNLKAFYFTSNSGFYAPPYTDDSYYIYTGYSNYTALTSQNELQYDSAGLALYFPNPNDKDFLVNVNGTYQYLPGSTTNQSLVIEVTQKTNGTMIGGVRHSYFYLKWGQLGSTSYICSRSAVAGVIAKGGGTFYDKVGLYYDTIGLDTNKKGFIDVMVTFIN